MKKNLAPVAFSRMIFLIAYNFLVVTGVHALTVDLYQDCESGAVGDTLTSGNMTASSHGTGGKWSAPSGRMWVAGNKVKQLPGTVTVRGGSTYTDTGTRTWTVANAYMLNYVMVNLAGSHKKLTMACHFTCGATDYIYNWYDLLSMHNPYSGVGSMHNSSGQNLHIDGETCGDDWKNWVVNPEPGIPMAPGKTYWVNLNLNYVDAKFNLAVFDPDNGYTQVGKTITLPTATQCSPNADIRFGQESAHGDVPRDKTYSNFDNIVIDYTNGTFPLLPDINTSSSSKTINNVNEEVKAGGNSSATVHFRDTRLTVTLPAHVSIRSPELTIVDLAGRKVYHKSLSVVLKNAGAQNGAVYTTVWRGALCAGVYIAIVKEVACDGGAVMSRTKIVVGK